MERRPREDEELRRGWVTRGSPWWADVWLWQAQAMAGSWRTGLHVWPG